jgi:type VI secretion system protein ImpL
LLRDMAALYEQLNRGSGVFGGTGDGAAGELAATTRKIEAEAARMPPAMAGVVRAVARSAAGTTLGVAKTQLDAEWKQKVASLCVNALEGRYPLRRNAPTDVTPDDFARLFAPNGLIDTIFNTNLRPFVDTGTTPWRAAPAEQGGIAISPEMLNELQLAAKIRESWFGTGATPTVRFEITPLWPDSEAKQITLAIDGQEIVYDGGSPRPTVVQWPGPGGVRQSQITVEEKDGQKYTLERSGAWSLLRLLDAGQLDSLGGPDRWRATFAVGPHRVTYQIKAGSVMNPLAMRDLDRFRCPRGL